MDTDMTFINNLRSRLHREVCDYVRGRYPRIAVAPCQGLFNSRCFYNAVEYARRMPDTEVVEVIYFDEGWPILHYLNRDAAGVYHETSLGHLAARLEYYKIRTIYSGDWDRIHDVFVNSQRQWNKQFLNGFHRALG